MKSTLRNFLFYALIMPVFILGSATLRAGGSIIPTGDTQDEFLKAYKFAMYYSYADHRFTSSSMDSGLFPLFGEQSIYWVRSGSDKGSFIFPDKLPSSYSNLTSTDYTNFDWSSRDLYAIKYKHSSVRIAVLKSTIQHNNKTVNWEAIYFRNLFDSYIFDNNYYFIDEDEINESNISGSTQLLIIPSFTLNDDDNKYYIDSLIARAPNFAERIATFLSRGGTVYAEGNAAYLIERLGYLEQGAVDFDDSVDPDPNTNLLDIEFANSDNPLSFTEAAVGDYLYSNAVPSVNAGSAEVIATAAANGTPVVFVLNGDDANGGRIVVNTGLPTIGGSNRMEDGSRQLCWTMNAVMYAFAKNVDVTRSIYNDLPDGVSAGKNAISYDRIDTFEVRILIRNLSDEAITDIDITENVRGYFDFVDVVSGETVEEDGTYLRFKDISMPAHSERTITYRLRTPDPDDEIHENVDKYISWRNYIYCSYNTTSYEDSEGYHREWHYRNYADVMFSARLVADTDLNWKNFLGLYYQPFKVFMIMENKERTSAVNTRYVQYIPKDVPFYWSDKEINIPILKTPGGKYVDVLKGSNNENIPEYDMDSDGHPDVWLDTASIYPKGYTISETEVYWLNPWEHLRSGDTAYYEDIDHDGIRAQDLDGDGVVDVEEPGDKIRVWKVTWDIGNFAGYDYADPYCSYEIWVDPPDLVKLAAGVGFVHGLCDPVIGMFYPYTPNLYNADLTDTTWSHWMERDGNDQVVWKQFIYQAINNYEGFTFIDTLATNYTLKPTDMCVGTVPQPHREFIAVLSLGGEEIDMEKTTPVKSLYSNLEYETIFGEERMTPIRSTYTYYAPLPNPLQFEYLSNNFTISDPETGQRLQFLPEWGKADLTFDMDASTEYTYYWIRNVGHDVDYNDPSEQIENAEELGDGVFGYMIYDIPKGLGGYKIDLPRKSDGSFDIDKIVEVDGKSFTKWLDNPNTKNEVEIWEDPFMYRVYIPQILIPPALDDDNFDGIDDWIDDRGDRFCSRTGFLHDHFMLDDGEDWLDYPEEPFIDDIYGRVDSGWYHGADGTYGDDFFENLGKTHVRIHALYEGMGREGPIDISKGGWLVVEEIFGGSPWVIFSHVLNGFAKGVDYKITSTANPSMVRFGNDTSFVKHVIEDENEPHYFDSKFDPYYVSYGYGESTITTYVGGKDPCSLIEPAIDMPAIVDLDYDNYIVKLVPDADPDNPDLEDYPKEENGCFLEVKIEVMNGTDDNWINTTIEPVLGEELGETEVVMQYVAYPRPLVPAKVDPETGEVIQGGDDIGAFRAGWRFNQPEGEVLIKMGETLPLLQPSRRAYFIVLLKLWPGFERGVYSLGFDISGQRRHYDNTIRGDVDYEVPRAYFSVTEKTSKGNIIEYQPLIIGTGSLRDLEIATSEYFTGLENVKWSTREVDHSDFDEIEDTLPVVYDANTGREMIDLSQFTEFPTLDNYKFTILEEGRVDSYNAGEVVPIVDSTEFSYYYDLASTFIPDDNYTTLKNTKGLEVDPIGPRIKAYKEVWSVNGERIDKEKPFDWKPSYELQIEVMIEVANSGNDMDEQTVLQLYPGNSFVPDPDGLPEGCEIVDNSVIVNMGSFVPGETKQAYLKFGASPRACENMYDQTELIPVTDVRYLGKAGRGSSEMVQFEYEDRNLLDFPARDFRMNEIEIGDPVLTYGSGSKVTAEFRNGVVSAENVSVNFYAITNHTDTVLVDTKTVDEINEMEDSKLSVYFAIPEDAEILELMAKVDGDDDQCEFCENNNVKVMTIPIQGPRWIQEVKNLPNPFTAATDFSYLLPREMREVKILIYAADGKLVDVLDNCPTGYGENTVRWNAAAFAKGGYIFNIIGINRQGETEKYFGKLIKQ